MNYIKQFFAKTIAVVLLVFVFNGSQNIYSQSRTDVIGTANGRTTVSTATGVDALTINPAGIGLGKNNLSFAVAPFGVTFGTTFFSIDDFNYYFGGDGNGNGRVLTPEEQNTFLKALETGNASTQIDIMPVGGVMKLPGIGTVGVGIVSTLGAFAESPGGLVDLLGGNLGFNPVKVRNGAVRLQATTSFQVSYSKELISSFDTIISPLTDQPALGSGGFSLSVGASARMIQGLGYLDAQIRKIDITPFVPEGFDSTYDWAVDLDYSTKSAGFEESFLTPGALFGGNSTGLGYGFDVGTVGMFQLNENPLSTITFGLTIVDIGMINWSKDVVTRNALLQDTIRGVKELTDQTLRKYEGNANTTEGFSTMLPTRLRVGGTIPLQAFAPFVDIPLVASVDYTHGINEIGSNSTSPIVGFGLQYLSTGIIPSVRAGVRTGGNGQMQTSVGLGWNFSQMTMVDIALGSLDFQRMVDVGIRARFDLAL